jgi:hypothetical protein
MTGLEVAVIAALSKHLTSGMARLGPEAARAVLQWAIIDADQADDGRPRPSSKGPP